MTRLPEPFPSVFDRLTSSDIRTDPFPHIVKDEALDPALCERLVETRLRHPALEDQITNGASNQRMAFHAYAMRTPDIIDDAWKGFARTHVSAEIMLRVAEIFADHWPDQLPDTRWLRGAKYGMFGGETHHNADVLTDARLELISPSLGPPWSHRAGHVDIGNRLFSALYYLRAPDDETEGGGLDLFRYRNRPPNSLDVVELADHLIEKVATIPYRANTLVVFPNSPLAIHGSEPRGYSERDRAYAFITAEVEKSLF
jgi:hypothetical protein